MAFLDTNPRKGDSDNNLLFKIAQELSERNGGAFPPMLGDSDNNLLYKIAQLIILGGGTAGTCAADLATCNALTTSLQVQLAACQAIQDMQVSWTPANLELGEMFGYGTGGTTNFPGITSITFRGDTSLAGFAISTKANLVALAFPNMTSLQNTSSFSTNPLLTSISMPVLGTSSGMNFTSNTVLPSLSFPSLTTLVGGSTFTASSNPALTSLLFPVLSTASGINVVSNISLASFTFPALVTGSAWGVTGNTALTSFSVPLLQTLASISITGNTLLTAVSFPSLITTAAGAITIQTNTALTTVSFPALVTGGSNLSGVNCSGQVNLANLTFTNWLPSNTRPSNFGGCALTQASVDHVLARHVANAAYVSGTITLSGGTNSTPSAAGLADKAILVGRGVTVLNN